MTEDATVTVGTTPAPKPGGRPRLTAAMKKALAEVVKAHLPEDASKDLLDGLRFLEDQPQPQRRGPRKKKAAVIDLGLPSVEIPEGTVAVIDVTGTPILL